MKVIVSDYDNTFNLHKINKIKNYFRIKQNTRAIKKFRKKGNLFIIATGRYYESIKKEIKRYQIEWDYLICNNGAEIYDKDYKLKYLKGLPDSVIDILTKLHFKLIKDKEGKTVVAAINYNVTQELIEQIKIISDVIVEIRPYKIKVISKVDKKDAINKTIKDYHDIKVYTFGDSENDLKMLNEFIGATLNKEISNKKIRLIKNLAKEINKLC